MDTISIDIDADLLNSDWLRTRNWDKKPVTVLSFLQYLGIASDSSVVQKENIAAFMLLPAAKAMPASLRVALQQQGLL